MESVIKRNGSDCQSYSARTTLEVIGVLRWWWMPWLVVEFCWKEALEALE